MNPEIKIQSNKSLMLLATLIWGVVFGCIISIAAYFVDLFFYVPLPYYLSRLFEWPECLVLGVAIAFFYILSRRTTVAVTKEQVQIQRGLKKWQFPAASFYNTDTQKKMIGYNLFVFYYVKRYLVFKEGSEKKKCRIYDMTEDRLLQIVQAVREQNNANMTIEEKIDIQMLLDDETERTEFVLDGNTLYGKEKKFLFFTAKLWAGITAVLCLILLIGYRAGSAVQPMFVILLVLSACLLLALPFQILHLKKKSKTCPGRIIITSDRFCAGGQWHSYSAVLQIKLTSPEKKSSSIYPVQHYMQIVENGGKTKYWMGSEASYGSYRQLCKCLEEAAFAYPGKVVY